MERDEQDLGDDLDPAELADRADKDPYTETPDDLRLGERPVEEEVEFVDDDEDSDGDGDGDGESQS